MPVTSFNNKGLIFKMVLETKDLILRICKDCKIRQI